MKKDYLLEMESLKMYLQEKYKGRENKIKIENIRYIGNAELIELINKEEYKLNKDIYVCEISEEGVENLIKEYYSEDFKMIAREDERFAKLQKDNNPIMLTPGFAKHPEIIEKLVELEKEGKLDLNKINQENLPKLIQVAETLGIDKEHIQSLSEIDLQRLQNPEKSNQITDSIQANSEVSINIGEHVSTRDNMETLVKAEGENFVKIDVVDLGKGPQFVGTKANGQMKELKSVKPIYGNRPNRRINAINSDGTKIEEEYAITMFEIEGREDEQLAISLDPYNRLKTSLVRTSPETYKSVSIPIEAQSQTIKHTQGEIKQLMDSNRNQSITEETRRLEVEKEEGRDPIDVKDIDDNPNNNTHEHLDDEEALYLANAIGDREEGAIERAKEKFEEQQTNNPELNKQQIIKKMEDEALEQSGPDLDRNQPQ